MVYTEHAFNTLHHQTLPSVTPLPALAALADSDLIATVKCLAQHERASTAALVAALAELDARRLYLGEGCSSLFVYCTRVVHLSEHAAYHRIEVARAARRFPIILERLAQGSLTLITVTLLAPHLTPANHQAVLAAAHHKSKREVEQQVVALAPRPDVSASIRKLPHARPGTMTLPVDTSLTPSSSRATPASAVHANLLAPAQAPGHSAAANGVAFHF